MPKHSDIRLAVHIAALSSLGAALIHAVVTPPHWEAWWATGLFFASLAGFQAAWGLLVLVAPHARWLLALALPANLGAATLWAISRVWGVPAGPAAGTTEAVGVADLAATFLGVLTALATAWALVPRVEHAVLRKGRHTGLLAGAAVAVALITAPGVVTGPTHSHSSGSHGEAGHHDAPAGESSEPTHQPSGSSAGDSGSPQSTTPSPDTEETEETTDGHHHNGSHEH